MEGDVVTRHAPLRPCFAIFHGLHYGTRPGEIETLHEPVQVVEYYKGKAMELAVVRTGRATRYPLRTFSGEWTVLDITPTH